MTDHSPMPFIAEYSPFQAQDDHELPSFRIFDGEGEPVAETDSGKPIRQQEADATLLAAAPELLEALDIQTEAAQAVLDCWERGNLAGAVCRLDGTISTARATIAKAKGGAP